MKKHTQGELRISKHATPEYAPQYGIYAGDGRGDDICIVKGENAEADAKLFAAAPKLLEACSKYVEIIEGLKDFICGDDLADAGVYDLDAMVDAAIAEAEL